MTYDRVQDPRHSKNVVFHQTAPATWILVNYLRYDLTDTIGEIARR